MKRSLSIFQIIAIILVGIFCLLASGSGLLYAALWSGFGHAVLPTIVFASYLYLIWIGVRPTEVSLVLAISVGIIVSVVSIVGLVKDFTAYNESNPGLYEWVNGFGPMSNLITFVFLALVVWRKCSWRKV